jgi:hypothetical protein
MAFVPLHVAGMELSLNSLSDDPVHVFGFCGEDRDVLEVDMMHSTVSSECFVSSLKTLITLRHIMIHGLDHKKVTQIELHPSSMKGKDVLILSRSW